MNNNIIVALAGLVEIALIGGIFLLYPRFARRGLLFGVYVGETAWSGDRAREITRGWYRGMIFLLAAAFVLEILLAALLPNPMLAGPFALLLVAGVAVLYVRAYRQAQQLAVDVPPPAVAIVDSGPQPSLLLPFFALAIGIVGGITAIVYAATAYPDLPARVPTHFGPTGAPDHWRPKSFFSVMLPAMMTLIMGVGMGGVSILTARAKRAVRYPHTEISLLAQMRFRTAVTRLLSGVSVLVTLMLTLMTIGSIRVGLGLQATLGWPMMALAIVMVVLAAGGSLYIGLRYGQGGARWERQAAGAALTDGLADNRRWVLGIFYVNRDDPSILVEDRFGLGYTLNIGNRKAIAIFLAFFGSIFALIALALLFG